MYYFAWVSDGNVAFGAEHIRNDEDVFSAKIEQAEGEFATLTVEIQNPSVGMLSPTRDQWCWFSKDVAGSVVPLFCGRLSSIPADLDRTVVTVEFTARPMDYSAVKAALAETLKVAPFYDPIWIPEEDLTDPDTVLEGRPAYWHIDRVTHDVTISDLTSGEDGVITIGPDSVIDNSVSVSFGALPVDTITMTAKVSWDQVMKRSIDISGKIAQGFGGRVESYTGQGLQKSWPVEGDDIGGDWSVGPTTLNLLSGTRVAASYVECSIQPEPPTMTNPVTARFYLWVFNQTFSVTCDTSRSRSETITFTATADVQSFKNDETPDPLELSYDSQRIVDPVDPGNAIPIVSAARRSYFGTDRGRQSIDFLMCVVRANFLKSARAVEIDFQVPYDDAIEISLRKDVYLQHPRIPGGGARGKVISYSLEASGSDGTELATVRIACTIGKGNTLSAVVEGTPSYSDGSYDGGYEAYTGATYQPVTGMIEYAPLVVSFGSDGNGLDDGMDLETMGPNEIVESFVVTNDAGDQRHLIVQGYDTIDNAIAALNAAKTVCELTLVPLNTGPFDNSFPMDVQPFAIPKGLDLEV